MTAKQKRLQNQKEGRLQPMAPLANPYVPFQLEDPPKYEARKALVRGTLFPGLDLPFLNKTNQKELAVTPMSELQALGFAIQELLLYLDTHRDDREALAAYQAYKIMYEKCAEQYEKKYGPLNHMTASEVDRFEWLEDPWPWEYCKNKGV